ncbi:MAG: hypothetical protein N4A33_01140 [Bacteriovoracaceae bacterium]|nr:hypothetical protein [Bacteriovoracaceae bacterium]
MKILLLTLFILEVKASPSIDNYISYYKSGQELDFSCQHFNYKPKYSSIYDLEVAKRSIISTLQYIGLEKLMRALGAYANLLELNKQEFENLAVNLIENDCSSNLTLFSKKKIKELLVSSFKYPDMKIIPSIENQKSFDSGMASLLSSKSAKHNEFLGTIENFRSFCSWDGDTSDYRLLSPFVANKFLMARVLSNLEKRSRFWNKNKQELEWKNKKNVTRVSCKNLVCRKSDDIAFEKNFPRMLGASKISDDFKALYCSHFRHLSLTQSKNQKINKIIKSKSSINSNLEVMNFIALDTGIPDIFNAVESLGAVSQVLRDNIVSYWDQWSDRQIAASLFKHNFEESLSVDLVSDVENTRVASGKFSVTFRFSLGEFDRVVKSIDKLKAKFNLIFPTKYLSWYRRQYISYINRSDYHNLENLKQDFIKRINLQLDKKKRYFNTQLWNEKMALFISQELTSQLLYYRGKKINVDSSAFEKIPLKLEFGLFALKFIRDKYKVDLSQKSIISKN